MHPCYVVRADRVSSDHGSAVDLRHGRTTDETTGTASRYRFRLGRLPGMDEPERKRRGPIGWFFVFLREGPNGPMTSAVLFAILVMACAGMAALKVILILR